MQLTRRALLASLAAVAAAATAKAVAPLTEREAFYVAEHKWAAQGLMLVLRQRQVFSVRERQRLAIRQGVFSAWESGDEQDSPARWRLARAMIGLREIDAPSGLERTLRAEVERLWTILTRPEDYDSQLFFWELERESGEQF